MLVARDGDGFVDQHDGDAVAHVVAQLEARVVERVLVDEVIQRTLVLRAGKDLEQTWIEAHRQLLWIDAEAATLLTGIDQLSQLGDMRIARRGVRGLEVEPEQGLGIGRAQVEPPVAAVDGQPIESVLVVGGEV